MATSSAGRRKSRSTDRIKEMGNQDDSSDSEPETEPAKAFHRRISTNRDIKTTKCIKEGYLMKQANSFTRWKRRYFKLKGRKFYYAKDTKSVIFDEIELSDCSIAECSVKNVNSSFQVITPFRNLVLCADSRREMEDWIVALKSAANREFYEHNSDHREMLSGYHNWYACSHARPTYCNVCREALSGVTSHGLSCEVCKLKAHKRCAVRSSNNCKWTTLASVGKDIIEEEDGSISMPHQWTEGNLPVSAKCVLCDRTCGSVLRLQDYRCIWCKCTIHAGCREQYNKKCPLGQCRISILPPTAITNLDSDGFWRATKPPGTSPLLVFVNSKSGDNQGVKMLRKFKQLLNPAQVFDLISGGPKIGLRLFQNFESFRVLVCGGDGSIGWVLNEIDNLGLHKQCQVGILPLGTGNDLARVLGWGAAFDDDTQLPAVLEKIEHAQIKMLDRWGILVYEGTMPPPRHMSSSYDPMSAYEDSVATHLSTILDSDNHNTVISSAKVLCETVKEFVAKVGQNAKDHEEGVGSISCKCDVLNQKLDALLKTLDDESEANPTLSIECLASVKVEAEAGTSKSSDDQMTEEPVFEMETTPMPMPIRLHERTDSIPEKQDEEKAEKSGELADEKEVELEGLEPIIGSPPDGTDALSVATVTRQQPSVRPKRKKTVFKPRDQLMSRANSLKKAIRQIIEHTERAVDEQNAQTFENQAINDEFPLDELGAAAAAPPSFLPPLITTAIEITEPSPDDELPSGLHALPVRPTVGLLVPPATSMATLSVPRFTFGESSDGESSTCSTPGTLSPVPGSPCIPSSPLPGSPIPGTPMGGTPIPGSPIPGSPIPGSPIMARPKKKESASQRLKSKVQSASRRISSVSTLNKAVNLAFGSQEKSPAKEQAPQFPLLGMGVYPMLPGRSQLGIGGGLSGGLAGGSFISKVLLANADALCAAATPLMEEDIDLDQYSEKSVMNNYFGIGLDAKISLEFHQKREEHPEKCRSRTKNMMWYGVIGSKEMMNKQFKNLEQRVQLECDGQRIPLPNLQGIVVLNIPSYMGGTNFWGSTKVGENFAPTSFDDKILEVVAVFGSVQLGISRVINLQRHRIAQCRSVKITIMGDEGVPVQVDGEAWIQPPGFIKINHKNRAQMLTRDKVFEEALKTWTEKQKIERPVSPRHHMLSEEETQILQSFVEATELLIKSVKVASICHSTVEQELFHLATQASGFLDRLYPSGRLAEPAIRTQVSDLVSSVRSLYNETNIFIAEKAATLKLRPDVEEKLHHALEAMKTEMKKVYDIGGLPHFQAIEEEASELHRKRSKDKSRFNIMRLVKGHKHKDKSKEHEHACPKVFTVLEWGIEEVGQWLDSLGMGDYKDGFASHDIRGQELLSLGRTDLKDLGVSKVGHLKRIQHSIKDIKTKMSSLDKTATVL